MYNPSSVYANLICEAWGTSAKVSGSKTTNFPVFGRVLQMASLSLPSTVMPASASVVFRMLMALEDVLDEVFSDNVTGTPLLPLSATVLDGAGLELGC